MNRKIYIIGILFLISLYKAQCTSSDPKVLTITYNCSQNFYEQNGEIVRHRNGSREYIPFGKVENFNQWIAVENDLPPQAHKLIKLCSNETSDDSKAVEKLVDLVITIALDPSYYIVENPGIVYNNTKFSMPINKWVKQSNIALIHTSLPNHLTILLAKLMAFDQIPIIVNDLSIKSLVSHDKFLYSPNIRSNFIEKIAPQVEWEEIIILHVIERKPAPTDLLLIDEMMKSFMEHRRMCIKMVEIRWNETNKWNSTLDIFNVKANETKIVLIVSYSLKVFKRYIHKYKSNLIPHRNFLFISFAEMNCQQMREFPCTDVFNGIGHEFRVFNKFDPIFLLRQPFDKVMNAIRLRSQFDTLWYTFMRVRFINDYDFAFLRYQILRTSILFLSGETINKNPHYAKDQRIKITEVDDSIADEYVNQIRKEGYAESKCSSINIRCHPGHFKTFGKLPKTKTKWNLEYGYYCQKCADGYVKENFGDGSCYKCQGYRIPNANQTRCIDPFRDNFEWFDSTAGLIATILASVGCLATIFIVAVFVHNRDTPCVKISDKMISFSHLAIILLSYVVLPVLHFWKPSTTVCASRPLSVAALYSLNVSIISVKSNKLVNAFLSKTRASGNEALKTTLTQLFVVVINFIIGISLCVIMFEQTRPASNDRLDFKSYQRLIYCNTDSHTSVVIGFMICVQLACFVQAFRCRNLPGYINEAMSITYATFITTVSFLVMYPIQFSRKNPQDGSKVQVLTLLGNTTVFFIFMYGKKTYFMLFQSHKNTTQFFRGKQMQAMEMKAKRLR